MSRILDISGKLENLVDVLAEYEDALKGVEDHIEVKGKLLEKANVENPAWQNFYDQKKIELHTLMKYMDAEVQRVRSKLFRSFKENHSRELNEREINRYIDSEPAYLTMNELKLEVQEMYDKYSAVVEAFRVRGYALNNITKIRVASLEDVEL
mgnify:CR=1 FL=1